MSRRCHDHRCSRVSARASGGDRVGHDHGGDRPDRGRRRGVDDRGRVPGCAQAADRVLGRQHDRSVRRSGPTRPQLARCAAAHHVGARGARVRAGLHRRRARRGRSDRRGAAGVPGIAARRGRRGPHQRRDPHRTRGRAEGGGRAARARRARQAVAPAAGGDRAPRPAALDAPRQGGGQPPLRRRQRVLRARARPVDDVLVRPVRRRRRVARGGPGGQARADLPQARPPRTTGRPAARRRVRLGVDGDPRRDRARRPRRRHHDQRRAGGRGAAAGRGGRRGRPGRDPDPGLPPDRRRSVRRDLVGRHGRTRRRTQDGRLLRHPALAAATRAGGC